LILLSLAACAPHVVSDAEARQLADARYLAHAKMLANESQIVPSPAVTKRSHDTVFVYFEPKSKTKIVVIVDAAGAVADTVDSSK
jgi:hypothetical protein